MHSPQASHPNATEQPFVVSCFVVPGFSMLALSSLIEPLRSVNRLCGEERYRWVLTSAQKGPVSASNGLEIKATHDLEACPEADLTIVVASLGLEHFAGAKLLSHIRWLRRQNRMFGAISNGTVLLAQAGVLDGRKVTVHWETLEALIADYPDLQVSSEMYRIDGNVFTAAGGAASMDMMLDLIASREGRSVAADVAEQFLHGAIRPSTDEQLPDVRWRYRLFDKRLEKAIMTMEKNCINPIRISDLAADIGVSERQLERLFLQAVCKSPSAFYLERRLERAHALMLSTNDSLEQIAENTGFSSQAHFSRAFKSWRGISPMAVRMKIRGSMSA